MAKYAMVNFWIYLLENELETWDNCPYLYQEIIRKEFLADVESGKRTVEEYERILGETHPSNVQPDPIPEPEAPTEEPPADNGGAAE